MAAVLGVSGLYHDAAAALLIDGQLVAAVQQERLSRIKGDPSLPWQAIEWCLAHAELPAAALDAVWFYEDPFAKFERVLRSTLSRYPGSARTFGRALRGQLGSKLWVLDTLAERIGVLRTRVHHSRHHHSHAASAYYPSGFAEAAVLTIDGVGEHVTTALWHGKGDELTLCQQLELPHSLGLFYAAITAICGWAPLSGEGTVMGLAAYGTPRFADALREVLSLRDDGSFSLEAAALGGFGNEDHAYGQRLIQLLGEPRRYAEPWRLPLQGRDQHYADIAASAQQLLQDAVVGLARQARQLTGASKLCLAGGVALNCAANGAVMASGLFEDIFVQPAAGDAGGALGAALLGARAAGDEVRHAMRHPFWGPPIDAARADELARALGFSVQRCASAPEQAAALIDAGELVAFAQGRCEWGPRALGQRSLLAPASDARVRTRLNHQVKRREPFRPFAPAMLRSGASEWFAASDNQMTPWMTTACSLRQPDPQGLLAAVLHRDQSARLQTVDSCSSPILEQVLGALHKEVAVVNTSLNGAAEPICCTAEDVLAFFAAHSVPHLLLDDMWIRKPS